MLALRLARFEHLVDIGRIAELRGVERQQRVAARPGGDAATPSSSTTPWSAAAVPLARAGHAADRPLPDPQPRHGRRFAGPRRPGGRVPGGGDRARRRRSTCSSSRGERSVRGRRLLRRALVDGAGARRAAHRHSTSRCGRADAGSASPSSPAVTATSPSPVRLRASSSAPNGTSRDAPSPCSASAAMPVRATHRRGGDHRAVRSTPLDAEEIGGSPSATSATHRRSARRRRPTARRVGAAMAATPGTSAVEEAEACLTPTIIDHGQRHAARTAAVEPRKTLADFLREDCRLTGTHLGCEHGVCGACTVLLDGDAVRACLMFAVQADGADVTTVEGLAPARRRAERPCSRRCTSATACSAASARRASSCRSPRFLRDATPIPTDDEIRDGLSGNLCRCTGYQGIIAAVRLPRPRRDGGMTADGPTTPTGRQPLRRPARPAPRGRPARHRPRHATSTTSSCRGCCTPPSCAATSPAAPIARSTSSAARDAARRGRRVHRRRPQRRRRRELGRLRGCPIGGRPFRVVADGDVRFAGEPVALVDRRVALHRRGRRASSSSSTSSRRRRSSAHDAALAPTAARRPPRARRQRRRRRSPRPTIPELDAIFESAAHVVTETFTQHRYLCVPMETPRRRVASGTPFRNELTVRISTQGAHGVRGFLGRALGLPENRIRVIMGDVGGGFGQKMFMLPDEVAVVARRQAPRPAGQVDRGPAREPDGRPARARRPDDR